MLPPRPTMPERPATIRRRRSRAFTLVELVLALALTTIVVGAATSVMIVASRALPSTSDASVLATDTASGLAMLEAELQCATRTRLEPTAITFTIPDRTGDSIPETIRYSWSGVSGQPLLRTEAAATAAVTGPLQSLSFTADSARTSGTRIGAVYVSITLDRGLTSFSTIRLVNEPEDNL